VVGQSGPSLYIDNPKTVHSPTTVMGDWNIVGPSHWHLCQALVAASGPLPTLGEPTRS
jgi:hypothetical protein